MAKEKFERTKLRRLRGVWAARRNPERSEGPVEI